MRIVIVTETFTSSMGYLENLLPKALSRLGHEVHVVSGDLQAYHYLPSYKDTYEPFLGPAQQPLGVSAFDGFTLHRIPHQMVAGYVALPALGRTLKGLRPDVVQVGSAATWVTMQAAVLRLSQRFRLFTGAHQTSSVMAPELLSAPPWSLMRLCSDVRRAVPGRLVAHLTEVCFAASEGCAEVATKYYGVPASKVAVCPLGSDTEVFHPAYDEASLEKRRRRRSSLGYGEGDIVCIYTGRFTDEKDPFCLAKAIAQLRADGERFVGLFLGDGPQAKRIAKQPGCSVLPFVPWNQLADYYRSADIGVWPAQESMSMIDAAACALPVVASDRMGAMERIAGNGLTYKQADAADLAKVLFTMRDSALRSRLGEAGHMKVRREYSWTRVAEIRANAYERAVC